MTSRQAAELYQRAGKLVPVDLASPAAEHIRGTKRKIVNGIGFRSTLEATAYQLLTLWQASGLICELGLQPKFILQAKFRRDGKMIREITYKADFSFTCESHPEWCRGEYVVIEAKGFRTEPYRMRRKLFLAKFPDVTFREWTRDTLKEMSR